MTGLSCWIVEGRCLSDEQGCINGSIQDRRVSLAPEPHANHNLDSQTVKGLRAQSCSATARTHQEQSILIHNVTIAQSMQMQTSVMFAHDASSCARPVTAQDAGCQWSSNCKREGLLSVLPILLLGNDWGGAMTKKPKNTLAAISSPAYAATCRNLPKPFSDYLNLLHLPGRFHHQCHLHANLHDNRCDLSQKCVVHLPSSNC